MWDADAPVVLSNSVVLEKNCSFVSFALTALRFSTGSVLSLLLHLGLGVLKEMLWVSTILGIPVVY